MIGIESFKLGGAPRKAIDDQCLCCKTPQSKNKQMRVKAQNNTDLTVEFMMTCSSPDARSG